MSDQTQGAARAAPLPAAGPVARAPTGSRAQALVAAAGLLGALASSSCCILPVALFSLGISGAWIGNFTRLAPYKPFFIAVTIGFLAAGYWMVRRSSKRACAGGDACERPLPARLVKLMLATATLFAAAAFGFDYVAPYLLS